MGLPLALYLLSMLLTSWDPFWFDLAFVRSRLAGQTIWAQGWLVLDNYTRLLSQNSWVALGVVGLWLLPTGKQKTIVLLALAIPLLILGRTAPLVELSFYYVIWLFPLWALGVGAIIRFGLTHIAVTVRPVWWGSVVAVSVILLPLIMSTIITHNRIQSGFGTIIDPFLVAAEDAIAATDYVNQNSDVRDVTIASPAVGWRLNSQTADFQMALAATGIATPHLPANIPTNRYAFDPRFSQARYVIVDPLWHNWAAIHVPTLDQQLQTVEQWPLRFRSGNILVYENPEDN